MTVDARVGLDERRPQLLAAVLFDEGLTYKAIADLCPPQARVSDQTVADIATGKRHGSDTSRQRILNALNRYERKKREYRWEDLYVDPPLKSRVGQPA